MMVFVPLVQSGDDNVMLKYPSWKESFKLNEVIQKEDHFSYKRIDERMP